MTAHEIQAPASSRRLFLKRSSLAVLSLLLPHKHGLSLKTVSMKTEKHFDVIIIGGSYSGMAAGMALGRALRSVLIIDSGEPCNRQTPHSHNFLTQDGKAPGEIARLAREQVQRYPSVEFLNARALSGAKTRDGFEVRIESGAVYSCSRLILATGIKDIMPGIPGFSQCWGISALHCPYCHGYEVKGQPTGILANGEAAFELSSLISNWTDDLTLYTNGAAMLDEQQKEMLKRHSIAIIEEEIAALEHNNGHIGSVVFRNGIQKPVKAIYSRLPFVQHSTIAQSLGCELTTEGYIKIDAAQRTTIPGVFACGDNTTRMRTVANAVAMGTTTGLMVNKEFVEERFRAA